MNSKVSQLLKINSHPKPISFIFALVIFLLASQLVVSHQLAVTGEQLVNLEKTAQELKLKNKTLFTQTSRWQSLDQIEAKARELGFRPIQQLTSISSRQSIAYQVLE